MFEVQSLLLEHLSGMECFFVPTDKVNLYPNEDDDKEVGGSIVAFMPTEN